MSQLYERIANLSPEQRELLIRRMEGSLVASESMAIPRRKETESAPLSFAQERLWFLSQLMPDNAFYNMPAAIRLTGPLNTTALERTLSEIVRRHEVLRTSFRTIKGRLAQVISPPRNMTLSVVDLRALPTDERETCARHLATEEAQRPFDLTSPSLLRFTLLRLGRQEHVVLLTMHHIVSDGWSVGIFIRELTGLYESFSRGMASPLEELPIQYADFATWQREWLQGPVLDAQVTYWKKQLGGSLPLLKMPTRSARPAVQRYHGAHQSFDLTGDLSDGLKALCRREEVTLFTLLLAAFQTLLYRYSGQEDILVGTPVAGRNRTEVEALIGFFVNTLVMRSDFSGHPTFRQLLARVSRVVREAYASQDLPFEKLVEELQPDRDLSRSPIFEVMFILQNAPTSALKLEGLTMEPLKAETGTSKFDLTLEMGEAGNRMIGSAQYNTDLFETSTIQRLLGNFQTLLEGIVANPDEPVATLPLLAKAERDRLLREWNDTGADYPRASCLHQLFEEQAARTPDAVAVIFEDEQWTYRQLNRRANRLAHYLRTLGVGPEVFVAICMDRSLEMMAGLLGILKAGGAYLPLDPAYPKERMAYVLEDSGAHILLTQRRLAENFSGHRARVLCLDELWETMSDGDEENPAVGMEAENLAYAIYTSGSTGGPKGVQLPHRAVVNFLNSMRRDLETTSRDVLLAVTTLAFDIAGLELFLPLMVGARVVLASREVATDGAQLAERLNLHGATMMQATPATWRLLLAVGWQGRADLKILCGGEALLDDLARQLAERGSALWNLYGPTETTIWSTIFRMKPGFDSVTVGRPIDNTELYLLDAALQPVPVGVPGELYIGGDGLARGYLNQPETTGAKFIPHPFASAPGARLYKTGDLARYLPGGEVEILGRLDHQLKLRGYRIELEEIEGLLAQHPAVLETVVVAKEYGPGDKRLVAYLVPNTQYQVAQEMDIWTAWQHEQVSKWQTVWDKTFDQATAQSDPTLNINGWNSSYTSQPFAQEEMRDWVELLVERVLSLKPRRVLELGCGTGLLLFRIAPHCVEYCGTDFSPSALNHIREQLTKPGRELPQVRLRQALAEDFAEVEPGAFDLVLLNSVIQYFPTTDYLLRVLAGALRAVAPGGAVFLGDVRSLPLLRAFHTSVQLQQSPASLSHAQLQQRVQKRLTQEQELVFDPAFFTALKRHLPQLSQVEIHLKRGRYHNELTKFRYDVILRSGGGASTAQDVKWMDWEQDGLTLTGLRRLLVGSEPELLGVLGVPNARLQSEARILQLLSEPDEYRTVEEILSALKGEQLETGVEPEDIWDLSARLPYAVNICSAAGDDGRFDLMFKRQDARAAFDAQLFPSFAAESDESRPLSSYTNNPLQEKLLHRLDPELRSFLLAKLPEYMVPSSFIMLDSMPLTPNGKVNRQALPDQDGLRPQLETAYVAPKSEVERAIAGIWQEALHLEKVGLHDNFFDLGGHSLLMVQVQSGLQEIFGQEISLIDMFKCPTVSLMTRYFRSEQRESPSLQESQVRAATRLQSMNRQRQLRRTKRASVRQAGASDE
jgi:amino acid adenylation domain-containing protein